MSQVNKTFIHRLSEWSPARYLILSGISFLSNVGLTISLHEIIGLSEEAAFLSALLLVTVLNFCGFRYFVYQSRTSAAAKQFLSYVASCCTFRAAEYGVFLLLHTALHSPYQPTVVGVLIVSFMSKYAFYKYVVFERS